MSENLKTAMPDALLGGTSWLDVEGSDAPWAITKFHGPVTFDDEALAANTKSAGGEGIFMSYSHRGVHRATTPGVDIGRRRLRTVINLKPGFEKRYIEIDSNGLLSRMLVHGAFRDMGENSVLVMRGRDKLLDQLKFYKTLALSIDERMRGHRASQATDRGDELIPIEELILRRTNSYRFEPTKAFVFARATKPEDLLQGTQNRFLVSPYMSIDEQWEYLRGEFLRRVGNVREREAGGYYSRKLLKYVGDFKDTFWYQGQENILDAFHTYVKRKRLQLDITPSLYNWTLKPLDPLKHTVGTPKTYLWYKANNIQGLVYACDVPSANHMNLHPSGEGDVFDIGKLCEGDFENLWLIEKLNPATLMKSKPIALRVTDRYFRPDSLTFSKELTVAQDIEEEGEEEEGGDIVRRCCDNKSFYLLRRNIFKHDRINHSSYSIGLVSYGSARVSVLYILKFRMGRRPRGERV